MVHVDVGVRDAMAIEETSGAHSIATPVGSIDHDVRPGAVLLSDGWTRYLHRSIIIAHKEMADAMARLRDVPLVAIAGADKLPILHGIAGPLLSRTVGPAKGMSLLPYTSDDSLPDIPLRVQSVRAHLRVAESHPLGPVYQILQALASARCVFHITLHELVVRAARLC
jgi:hypothetical protein